MTTTAEDQAAAAAEEREVAAVAAALAVEHGLNEHATNFYPAARLIVDERKLLRRLGREL